MAGTVIAVNIIKDAAKTIKKSRVNSRNSRVYLA
jgi:hypothetical protein